MVAFRDFFEENFYSFNFKRLSLKNGHSLCKNFAGSNPKKIFFISIEYILIC